MLNSPGRLPLKSALRSIIRSQVSLLQHSIRIIDGAQYSGHDLLRSLPWDLPFSWWQIWLWVVTLALLHICLFSSTHEKGYVIYRKDGVEPLQYTTQAKVMNQPSIFISNLRLFAMWSINAPNMNTTSLSLSKRDEFLYQLTRQVLLFSKIYAITRFFSGLALSFNKLSH
jgi:hypothetical protein